MATSADERTVWGVLPPGNSNRQNVARATGPVVQTAAAGRSIGPELACGRCGSSLAELIAEVRLLRAEVHSLRAEVRAPAQPLAVLDLDEAADYLGVSRRTAERWIAAGKLRAAKLSAGKQGTVRVVRSELDRFLAERTRR